MENLDNFLVRAVPAVKPNTIAVEVLNQSKPNVPVVFHAQQIIFRKTPTDNYEITEDMSAYIANDATAVETLAFLAYMYRVGLVPVSANIIAKKGEAAARRKAMIFAMNSDHSGFGNIASEGASNRIEFSNPETVSPLFKQRYPSPVFDPNDKVLALFRVGANEDVAAATKAARTAIQNLMGGGAAAAPVADVRPFGIPQGRPGAAAAAAAAAAEVEAQQVAAAEVVADRAAQDEANAQAAAAAARAAADVEAQKAAAAKGMADRAARDEAKTQAVAAAAQAKLDKEQAEALAAVKVEVTVLQQEATARLKEAQALTAELDKERARAAQIQQTLGTTQGDLATSRAQYKQITTDMAALQGQGGATAQQLQAAQQQLRDVTAQLITSQADAKRQATDVAARQADIATLQAEMTQLRDKFTQLDTARKAQLDELVRLAAIEAQFGPMQQELTIRQQRIDQLQAAAAAAAKQAATMLAAEQARVASETARLGNEITVLQNQLARAQAQEQALRNQITAGALPDAKAQLLDYERQLKELQAKLDEQLATMLALRAELAKINDANTLLRGEVNTLRDQLRIVDGQRDAAERRANLLQDELVAERARVVAPAPVVVAAPAPVVVAAAPAIGTYAQYIQQLRLLQARLNPADPDGNLIVSQDMANLQDQFKNVSFHNNQRSGAAMRHRRA